MLKRNPEARQAAGVGHDRPGRRDRDRRPRHALSVTAVLCVLLFAAMAFSTAGYAQSGNSYKSAPPPPPPAVDSYGRQSDGGLLLAPIKAIGLVFKGIFYIPRKIAENYEKAQYEPTPPPEAEMHFGIPGHAR